MADGHTTSPTSLSLDAYIIPRAEWSPSRENATADLIAAEIVALTGVDWDAARIAAGSWMAFRNAPDHGLGDLRDGLKAGRARVALKAWLASKAAA